MPGRIKKHSKVVARLDLRLTGTERDDLPLAFIEILHFEVDMGLLGAIGTRPDRWLMIRGQLKRQRGS